VEMGDECINGEVKRIKSKQSRIFKLVFKELQRMRLAIWYGACTKDNASSRTG
jgi:hypothetical protein